MDDSNYYMSYAIQEAKKGYGNTFVNPLVGAVIVKDNEIIGSGFHKYFGGYHAEVEAINSVTNKDFLRGSSLYVSLEPCVHVGKQPPCVNSIIEAGISNVFIGQADPNPIVAGKGISLLKHNGIHVKSGILESAVKSINSKYNFSFSKNKPYITIKQAMTSDGKIGEKNKSIQITGSEAKKYVYKERATYNSILFGSETILNDNPKCLVNSESIEKPLILIIDRRGRVFEVLKKLNISYIENNVWIFTENYLYNNFKYNNVRSFLSKKWNLQNIIEFLSEKNVQSIYVEGGKKIHSAFLREKLWNEIISYVSKKPLNKSGITSALYENFINELFLLKDINITHIGKDLRIRGENNCFQG